MKKGNVIISEPARLDVENISVTYNGNLVLDRVSFQVQHGHQVAVLGPNGSGKSTLFKALVGLLPLSSGRIYIHGQPLGHHSDCVAFIPQREEVDWHFPVTVFDVVMMGRYGHQGWFRPPTKLDREIVYQSMEEMGIVDIAYSSIGNLSGGQQQRVFLARALAQKPHILLLDEPFTGVDAATQESTLDILKQLKEQQVTVMISTHDLNMAARRFENILLLKQKVIAVGSARHVFNAEAIKETFGERVLSLDSLMVVDECCQ